MVGFLSGVLGTQFIVTAPLPRFLLLVVATALHAAIFIGLYTLLNLQQFPAPYTRSWARRSEMPSSAWSRSR